MSCRSEWSGPHRRFTLREAAACFGLEADQSESRSGRTLIGRSLRFLANGPLADDQFQQEQGQSDQDEDLMQWIHSDH